LIELLVSKTSLYSNIHCRFNGEKFNVQVNHWTVDINFYEDVLYSAKITLRARKILSIFVNFYKVSNFLIKFSLILDIANYCKRLLNTQNLFATDSRILHSRRLNFLLFPLVREYSLFPLTFFYRFTIGLVNMQVNPKP